MSKAQESSDALASSLAAVAAARRARENAEVAEVEAVKAARGAGASWTSIGELYGLTKQGAQQRFKTRASKSPKKA